MVKVYSRFVFVSMLFVFGLLVMSSAFSALGDEYHLTLLAVQEQSDGSHIGSTADLFVEVREGTGRVFLDTTPLTKLDTQVSTRYAKQVACEYYDLPCDQFDFFYAIRSETGIIGGPSAGAAMAALTSLAVMDIEKYDDSVALTGTINSGGTVGPVGGVKEKIEAADALGLGTVLVPLTALDEDLNDAVVVSGSSENNSSLPFSVEPLDLFNESNFTLEEYVSSSLDISAFEVGELDDVMFHLTGERYLEDEPVLEVDLGYSDIMAYLQNDLCTRAELLFSEYESLVAFSETLDSFDEDDSYGSESDLGDSESVEGESRVSQFSERLALAQETYVQGDYYASASFCFGLNTELRSELYSHSQFELDDVEGVLSQTEFELDTYQSELDSETLETISDLQTAIIVSERISDASARIDSLREELLLSSFEVDASTYASLGYLVERAYSAQSWMSFFSLDGQQFDLDEEELLGVCEIKIAEATERFNYAQVYAPFSIQYIQDKIDLAKSAQSESDYLLCLAQATQAKADSTSLLSSVGISESAVGEFLVVKERAAARMIAENSLEGSFPILGYSYYQYAQNLEDAEPYSALLYYEYALEMGELSVYFPGSSSNVRELSFNDRFDVDFWSFLFGGFAGFALGAIFMFLGSLGVSSGKK